MKAVLFILALIGGLAHAHQHPGGAHLKFVNGSLHAHAEWTQGPVVGTESILQIDWKNGSDHSPIKLPGTFEVSLWMPAHGHGSSPTRLEQAKDTNGSPLVGSYLVRDVYFTMGGEWEVRVKLTYVDGVQETQSIVVNLAGGHHNH